MRNFNLQLPTKVIFGKDTENQVGAEIAALGAKKVLVHFGGKSAKASGLLDRVHASLDAAGIKYVDLGGVKPNPLLSLVREGIALSKKEGVDFILAVGGGSAIDSAKGIAYGLRYDGDLWDIYYNKVAATDAAPLGCVLTIAAAGSEMSDSSVLTKDEGMIKVGYSSDLVRPKFAVMNPELTYTLPEYQTMAGVVDILMHTIERYFTNDSGMFVDRMSEALLVSTMEMGRRLLKNPKDYEARAEVMWTGSVSHNGLTGAGRAGDFATHQMGHELSAMFDATHGASLSAVWGSWARYVYKHDAARFAQFAVRAAGVRNDFFDVEGTALRGIEALEEYFRSIKMPTSIAELGVKNITDAQLAEMTEKCSRGRTRKIGGFVLLDHDDIRRIYEMAK